MVRLLLLFPWVLLVGVLLLVFGALLLFLPLVLLVLIGFLLFCVRFCGFVNFWWDVVVFSMGFASFYAQTLPLVNLIVVNFLGFLVIARNPPERV